MELTELRTYIEDRAARSHDHEDGEGSDCQHCQALDLVDRYIAAPGSLDNPHLRERPIEEFQATGLVFLVNSILHVFGWALTIVCERDGSMSRLYPSRTSYRGFAPEAVERGYGKLNDYLCGNVHRITAEATQEQLLPTFEHLVPGIERAALLIGLGDGSNGHLFDFAAGEGLAVIQYDHPDDIDLEDLLGINVVFSACKKEYNDHPTMEHVRRREKSRMGGQHEPLEMP